MSRKTLQSLGLLAALVWGSARADDGDLVERVAVRNRLFEVVGRWEVGARFGLSMVSFLTDTYNFNLSVAYNPLEWLAVEARGGYAVSFNNFVAEQSAVSVYHLKAAQLNELTGTWGMGLNGVLGLRFQPVYGKLNLVADLPVHFQVYLWAGAGVASLSRTSPTLCLYPNTAVNDPQRCVVSDGNGTRVEWANYVSERRLSPLVSLALGLRLFIAQHHAVGLEVRSWSYTDAFYRGVNREQVSPATPTGGGQLVTSGFTHLAQLDLGYVVMF